MLEKERKGGRGRRACVCTVHAAVHQEQPERELVLGMWYHYLSQSQAHTPRSTIGALYYAPAAHAVAYTDAQAAANARASSEYTLRDVPYLFVLHTPPRGACFLRESLRYRHRDEDDGSLGVRDFRSTCAKTLPERKRATPRFRNPSRAGSTWSTKSVAVARECV